MTLLSVDFDFFFPIPEYDPHELYDWSMSEKSNLFYSSLWTIRAAAFLRFNNELPCTSGEEEHFWERFNIKKNAPLFYAESHSFMLHKQVIKHSQNVLSFDAHHDAGYSEKNNTPGCDNWVVYLARLGSTTKVVYPSWKFYAPEREPKPQVPIIREVDDGRAYSETIDAVFLCRSGAWVPGWLDDHFDTFLDKCPTQRRMQIGPIVEREWNPSDAHQINNATKSLFSDFAEKTIAILNSERIV